MNQLLTNRLKRATGTESSVNVNFKTSCLPEDLNVSDIDFSKSRGSIRVINQNVLTPAEENEMIDNVLEYDYEH